MNRASAWLESFHQEQVETNKSYMAPIREDLSLKRRHSIKAKTVAISSGKGGVGKTSISIMLASQLAENHSVLLIDLDVNLSNTYIKLGEIGPSNFYGDILKGENIESCMIRRGRLSILPGLNGDIQLFNNEFNLVQTVIEICRQLENKYDYILMDCPAGLGRDLLAINALCDNRIIILNPDRSSLTDSYGLIKILSKEYGVRENFFIVNKVNHIHQYNRIAQGIVNTSRKFLDVENYSLGQIRYLIKDSEIFDKLMEENSSVELREDISQVKSKLFELEKVRDYLRLTP